MIVKPWKEIVKDLLKITFVKYFIIGGFITVFTTFVLWLAIDIFGFLAVIVNPIVSIFIFCMKFFIYGKAGLFNNNKGNFIKYVGIWIFLVSLSTFLLWVLVDKLHLWVVTINPLIVIAMFLLRFKIYKKLNMLREEG